MKCFVRKDSPHIEMNNVIKIFVWTIFIFSYSIAIYLRYNIDKTFSKGIVNASFLLVLTGFLVSAGYIAFLLYLVLDDNGGKNE